MSAAVMLPKGDVLAGDQKEDTEMIQPPESDLDYDDEKFHSEDEGMPEEEMDSEEEMESNGMMDPPEEGDMVDEGEAKEKGSY